ncbi:carboxypeptidase-like regulatory domain-containing protein [uncultured Paludibaculum sp.]|uniref:carboxypeptidase-like regulatory domain-containing protein n=1 Tax=uncultured Paludibaculum sp. TaxID=1765020 RepID=UPI002AABD920|nr:carboxypeptidase-like regulatory domain-containing protein [uncultured Paludibaculum sp.]
MPCWKSIVGWGVSALLGLLILSPIVAAVVEGRITGTVRNTRGSEVMAGVEVQILDEARGTRWRLYTDEGGQFEQAGLPRGVFSIRVRMPGFRTVSRGGLMLAPGQTVDLELSMEMLALQEVITVTSGRDEVDPSNGGTLLLSRTGPGATIPTNGRDFRSTFDLMPGVLWTPAAANDAGQFSANGQRPNSNTFQVDGVSANTGVGGNALPGSFPGASLPAMTIFGSTENLVAPESTQSVEFRSSSFAPEHGERPGAETAITTRSGTNEFHGSYFERRRDPSWRAQDWFFNSQGGAFNPNLYNRVFQYRGWGGTVGGAVRPNRTFFFFSFDDVSLLDFGHYRTSVPSISVRQITPTLLSSVLTYFPSPTGRDLGGGESEGVVAIGTSAKMKAYGVRVDHSLGNIGTVFARVVNTPSRATSGVIPSGGSLQTRTVTVGSLATKRGMVHDVRFNLTTSSTGENFPDFRRQPLLALAGMLPGFHIEQYSETSWGWSYDGSIKSDLTRFLPAPSGYNVIGISVPGLGQFVQGNPGLASQTQWEFRDTIALDRGPHQFRAGVALVSRNPSREHPIDSIRGSTASLQSLVDGSAFAITVSQIPKVAGRVSGGSLFLQDTARLGDSLSLVYGVRWEWTPPSSHQMSVPTVSGVWSSASAGWQTTSTGDVSGSAPWPTRYAQFAPRVGLAYRLKGRNLVIRSGAGLFLDTALGTLINPINGGPFNSWELSAGGTGIGASAPGTEPGGPGSGPVTTPDVIDFLSGRYPALKLPASWQWRTSLEQSVGQNAVAAIAYAGASGRNLLGNAAYVDPNSGVMQRFASLTRNSSSYHSLQLRFSGQIRRSVYTSTSYTWAHSIDDSSQDSAVFLIQPGYRLSSARASSGFDVRHALTSVLSLRAPDETVLGRMPNALRDWTLSGILRARTGFPIDVLNGEPALGLRYVNSGRPNLVPGVPLWLTDAGVAGGRRLNRAAFSAPVAGAQGNLGRNAMAGNGLFQWDVSMRRQLRLYRRVAAEAAVNVLNVTNHPNFADPVPYLSSPWFGQSTSMQNLMLGSGRPNGGLPPMFQPGGQRTVELSLKLVF